MPINGISISQEKVPTDTLLERRMIYGLLNCELDSHKVLILSGLKVCQTDHLFCDADIFIHVEMLLNILFVA